MSDLQLKVGARIRAFRNAKGYSIEELAHIADLNAVHLASLERGEKNATLTTLEKVASALDITFLELFSFECAVGPENTPLIEKIVATLRRLSESDQQFVYDSASHLLRKTD